MTDPAPARDPGLQQERTVLAWRRTGLALVVGALTLGRLTMDTLGTQVLVPAVVAAALAAWVVVSTLRGGRLARPHPRESQFSSMLHDGRVPAVLALVAASLAAVEFANLLVQIAR